jgi:hypothetical protein
MCFDHVQIAHPVVEIQIGLYIKWGNM